MLKKYVIFKKNAQEEMDKLFNQPAGLRKGLVLAPLLPIQPNTHRLTGHFFCFTDAIPQMGRARESLETYSATITTNTTRDMFIIETDNPEEYGLFEPLAKDPFVV